MDVDGFYVFEVGMLVAYLCGVAGAVEHVLLAEVEIGTVEDEAHRGADDADKREEGGANLKIAKQDEGLDDDAAGRAKDDHDRSLNAEKSRSDKQNGGAEGEQPCGPTEISPRHLHCAFLSGVDPSGARSQLCYKPETRANQKIVKGLRRGTAAQIYQNKVARAGGKFGSGFVGGGDMGLRDEFSESNASEDKECSGSGAKAKALAGDEKGSDPGKDGFEGEQKRGMGGGQD